MTNHNNAEYRCGIPCIFTRHCKPVLIIDAVDIEFCNSVNDLSALAVNKLCFKEFQLLRNLIIIEAK